MCNDSITPRRSILTISPLDAIVCLLFAKRCDHQSASSIVLAGWRGIIARWSLAPGGTPKTDRLARASGAPQIFFEIPQTPAQTSSGARKQEAMLIAIEGLALSLIGTLTRWLLIAHFDNATGQRMD